MQQVLPIVIICCAGLAVCAVLLIYYFVRFVVKHFKRKKEEFELDENILTIHLDKKQLRKH